jgi:regulator of Ty1 transposition protein 103
LINCLKSLENTASSDAVIRERIAKLPPEVSDINLLDKLKDKNEAEQLIKKVDEACVILKDYNDRLAKELNDREKISYKLAAFCRYQKEIQKQQQKELNQYIERLNKVKRVKGELKLHLKNLPDLTKLPLEAKLPAANDLFLSSTKKEDDKSNDSNNQNVLKDSNTNNNNLTSEEDKNDYKKESDYEITNNSVSV